MTGRERLQAVFDGRRRDRLSWTTAVDHNVLDSLDGMNCVDFYRYVDCDNLQLGGWGTQWQLRGCELVMPGVEESFSIDEHGDTVIESRCSRGTLTGKVHYIGCAVARHANVDEVGYAVEFPVKTIENVRLLRKRWEDAYYQRLDERAEFNAIDGAIGDGGVTTLFMTPSVIPHLLEEVMGIEQFYYLFQDYPDEMDSLIRVMQEKELSRFDLASYGPCDIMIIAENTSTRYISPYIYEKYNMPSQRAFAQAAHARGKKAIAHMCGHVKDLLPIIKETNIDGIHALTPPPIGDTQWESALDVLGEDLIIIGILTSDIFQCAPLDEIGPALDSLITPRIMESRFVLGVPADGLPTPVERFNAVRDWVEGKKAERLS